MKENAHSSQYLLMNKDVCTALFLHTQRVWGSSVCRGRMAGPIPSNRLSWPAGFSGAAQGAQAPGAYQRVVRAMRLQRYGGISAGHTCSFAE